MTVMNNVPSVSLRWLAAAAAVSTHILSDAVIIVWANYSWRKLFSKLNTMLPTHGSSAVQEVPWEISCRCDGSGGLKCEPSTSCALLVLNCLCISFAGKKVR